MRDTFHFSRLRFIIRLYSLAVSEINSKRTRIFIHAAVATRKHSVVEIAIAAMLRENGYSVLRIRKIGRLRLYP